MNKTAIKNFAIWARNKLIADVRYRAGLVGITEQGVQTALPQSDTTTEFYDIGTATPYAISGQTALRQRRNAAEAIRRRAADSDYPTAYRCVMEEVAYTWFNRLIAVRFMEVNDYLPGRVRVLSSESGKIEPDLVTNPFDAELSFTSEEEQTILQLKQDNKLDELFRLLFIKQCNALAAVLPALFEQTEDYTELLLNLSVVDQDGVVWRLTHDIPEDDFNVEKGGQVEIIGWLYQYYNTEPKAQVFARPSGQKIKKEEIPAATQLFTPDWIVRYMVENSLGRLWLEGHPDEELRAGWKYYLDEAEQEPDVAAQLDELRTEHRSLTPENIKVIDPCMGSGHILVYAFDVLMQIYEKAGWERREATRSIVENNLYGLDIDKRAYQLAYFAVMMKARQYDRRFFSQDIAPNLCHTEKNIKLLFVHNLPQNDEIAAFLDDSELAEHMGSLIIPGGYNIEALKEHFLRLGLQDLNQIEIFEEENLKATLETIRRNNILAQQYDIVVTNPPYMGSGNMDTQLSKFVKKYYPDSKSDLFAVFIERGLKMIKQSGYLAMITQHAWMFLSSFEKLRAKLQAVDTVNMVHLGARAFEEIGGEVVQTTSFVMRKSHVKGYKGVYCRLTEPNTQQGKKEMFLAGENRHVAQQDNFSKIPGTPVAYWVSNKVLSKFINQAIGDIALLCQGLTTTNNEKYVRFWYEIGITRVGFTCADSDIAQKSGKRWFPFNKGGSFCKWYGNNDLVVNYENDGIMIKSDVLRKYPYLKTPDFVVKNSKTYFHEGLTWSALSNNFSIRWFPAGAICADKGQGLFASHDLTLYCCGLLNSVVSRLYLRMISPTLDFNCGYVRKIPYIMDETHKTGVSNLVDENISVAKTDWDSFETSWDFTRHPLVRGVSTVAEAFATWEAKCNDRFTQLKANEEELNRIFIDSYGLQDELTPEVEDKDVTVRRADLGRDIRSLLSYVVGCMFGRYSLDEPGLILAGYSKREHVTKTYAIDSPELEVFARKNPDGSVSYVSHTHWVNQERFESFPIINDNILPLTDESYLEDDIISRLCQWLRTVYGPDTLEENLDFIAKALGNKGSTSREVIRNYFLKDFFADHCKIYQKRPIYWLFDSGKQNGFKALVYLHRYTPDTIGKLRVDYLHRLQRVYASEIERMQDMIDNSQNPREVTASTKRKEKLQKQLKECREYDEKIAHLALARIELDLDDGVKVNYEKVQTAADGKKYPVLGKV